MQGSLYARRVRSSLAAGVVYGTHRIARYLFHLCPLTLSTLSTFSAQWRPSVVPSPRLVPISIEASSRADSERSSHSLALPSLGLIYLQLWLLTHPRCWGVRHVNSGCEPVLVCAVAHSAAQFQNRFLHDANDHKVLPSFAPLFRLRLFGQWVNSHQVLYRLDHQTTWRKSSFPLNIGTSDVIQELWLE